MCSAISDAAGNSNLGVTKSTNAPSGKTTGDFSEFFTLITALETEADGPDIGLSELGVNSAKTDVMHSAPDFDYSSLLLPKDFNEILGVSDLKNTDGTLPTANTVAMLRTWVHQNDNTNIAKTDLTFSVDLVPELSTLLSNLKHLFSIVDKEDSGIDDISSQDGTKTISLMELVGKDIQLEDLRYILRQIPENAGSTQKDFQIANIRIDKSVLNLSDQDTYQNLNKVYIGPEDFKEAAVLKIEISNDDVTNINLTEIGHQIRMPNRDNIIIDDKISETHDKQIIIRLTRELPSVLALSVNRHIAAEHSPKSLEISLLNGKKSESEMKLQPDFEIDSDHIIRDISFLKKQYSAAKVVSEIDHKPDLFENLGDIGLQPEQLRAINSQFRNFLDFMDTKTTATQALGHLNEKIDKNDLKFQNEILMRLAIKPVSKRSVSGSDVVSKSMPMFLSTVSALSWRDIELNQAGLSENKNIYAHNNLAKLEIPVKVINSMNLTPEVDATQIKSVEPKLDGKPVLNLNFDMAKPINDLRLTPTNSVPLLASAPNQLSLLDAQFTSRLAAIAIEQALNVSEAVELNLEPKSFGKLTVNASIDASGLDVKLHADNHATLAILRGSEGILSTITEQNGLKLAGYSVDIGGGASDNSGTNGQNQKSINGDLNGNSGDREGENGIPSDDQNNEYILNLIA